MNETRISEGEGKLAPAGGSGKLGRVRGDFLCGRLLRMGGVLAGALLLLLLGLLLISTTGAQARTESTTGAPLASPRPAELSGSGLETALTVHAGDFATANDFTIAAGVTISRITAGGGHTCALATDGRVMCWGGEPLWPDW